MSVCILCICCGSGAVYVPEVGPMGDEFCETERQAAATGQRWLFVDGEWTCPCCAALDAELVAA